MRVSLFKAPPKYATAYTAIKNVYEINIEGRNTFDCLRIEISPSVNVEVRLVYRENAQIIS